jgi:arabinogalactan oligomer / maltooligosaccharide transport system substrate-binding protein
MKSRRRIVAALLVVAFAGLVGVLAGTVHASTKAGNTITIWTDQNRSAAIHKIATQWEAKNPGVSVNIVQKNFGDIRDQLGTVAVGNAPDVIVAAHDWTGQLAANGLVVPLFLSKAAKAQFPAYTLNAFSYGVAVKHLYAVPTQIENIGLVVNTKLAKVPTTFAQLTSEAMKVKKHTHAKVGIAVQQGSGGDAYHMYPFFSGLGGYIFGTNHAGNLDPSNVGVANKFFLKHAKLIDSWNKMHLINSAVDSSTAQQLFISKKVAFWITGPWNSSLLKSSKIPFKVVQMPKIAKASVPFLGVQGLMVSKYAAQHGVSALAQDFVTNYMTKPAAQLSLALAEGRYPASTAAGKSVHDKVLAEFGRAGKGGVPMPNIPQMNNVWGYLGQAWVVSTKGSGATKAAKAFKAAAHNIKAKIG